MIDMLNSNTVEMDETNWDVISSAASQAASTANKAAGQEMKKNIFLKVKQGFHTLRILPGGNKLDKLPYMRTGQHTIQAYDPVNGRQKSEFCLCWNFLFDNLMSKATPQEKKDNTLIGYLIKQGKLLNEDMKKFQDYKCPFCAAFQVMDTYGVDKGIRSKFLMKEQFLFNVYYRLNPQNNMGDNSIYVWGCSKTQFNKVVTSMQMCREAGVNPISLTEGRDWLLQATGEGFGGAGQGRRYDIQVKQANCPVDIGQQIPYDLAEVVTNGFKTYQECVNMLKKFGGELLTSIGYVIPGDQVLESANVVLDNHTITPVNAPKAVTPVPNVAAKPTPSGNAIELNGVLYEQQADGSLKPLF